MELTRDDTALSEAVEAHFTQLGGDLREEIAQMKKTSKSVSSPRNSSFHDGVEFQSTSRVWNERALAHPVVQPSLLPQPRHDISHRDVPFESHRPPVHASRSEPSLRFDERRVFHSPHPVDSHVERPSHRDRYTEPFNDQLDDKGSLLPSLNAKPAWHPRSSHSPPLYHPDEGLPRRRVSREAMRRPPPLRRDLPPPLPSYSRPREMEHDVQPWTRPCLRRDPNPASLHPRAMHEVRMRRESPPSIPPPSRRRKPRAKQHSTRIPSRVTSEEEASEESFDDMLLQYKKNQNDQLHYNESSSGDFKLHNTRSDRFQLERNKRYYDVDYAPVSHEHVDHRPDYAAQSMREEQRLGGPLKDDSLRLERHNVLPRTYEPQSSLVTGSLSEPVSRNVPIETVKEPRQPVGTVQPIIDTDNQEDENRQPENDEEDEDEELLKLRLAALSSAYTRNIDIAKESSVSDGKADEPSLNAEDNKSRKKKSKQPKEKKKSTKKESKKSPRSSTSDSKKTHESSEIENKVLPSVRKIRSPEKNFSDPKILTLGSEVMKKKSMQEQGELREIRSLKNPEEGVKRFMDLIQSKNDRDQKKLNKSSSKDGELDNYDEVEMDVENLNSAEDDKLEIFLPQNTATTTPDAPETVCETDAKSDVSAHTLSQPLPPGVDEIDNSLDPHQESIWEMLEQPLAEPAPLDAPASSAATPGPSSSGQGLDLLISSIRANLSKNQSVDENLAPVPVQKEPSPPPTPPVKIPGPPKEVKAVKNIEIKEQVGSPYEFEHAFQPMSNPSDSYPDMATDLSFARPDERVELIDDVTELDQSQANSQDDPDENLGENAENEVRETENNSQKQQRQKLPSTEDEHELRAKLLSDMVKRREKKPAEQGTAVKNEPGPEQAAVVQARTVSQVSSQPSVTKTNDPSTSVEEQKKKPTARRRRYQAWVKLKKQNRTKRKKAQRELHQLLSGANAEPLGPLSTAIHQITVQTSTTTTARNTVQAKPTKKRLAQSRKNLKVIVPTPSTTMMHQRARSAAVSKTSAVQPVTKVTKPAPHPLKPKKVVSQPQPKPIKQESRPLLPTSSSVAPQTSKSSLNKVAAPPAVKSSPSLPSQRLLHPPVVINLDHSSDEEDHVTSDVVLSEPFRSAIAKAVKQHPGPTSKAPASTAVTVTPPSLLPHPSILASEQYRGNLSGKRKAPSEPENPAKKLQTTFPNKGASSNHSNAKQLATSDQEALKNAKAKSESAQRQLVDVEEKLKKVRHLLGQDKIHLSRLRQKQTAKEAEAKSLKLKIDELKDELMKHEKLYTTSIDSVEKIKKDSAPVSSTMEKRRKLESRFLHQIGELRQEITQSTTTINNLAAKSNISQIIGAIRNVRRNSGDKEKKNHIQVPKTSEPVTSRESIPNKPEPAVSIPTTCPGAKTTQKTSVAPLIPVNNKNAAARNSKNAKVQLHRKEKKLRETERKIELQKGKILLKKTEIKLQLIKKKAKQSLKAKKLRKSMMDQSIHQAHQVQRKLSTSQNQSKLVKTAIKIRKSSISASDLEKTSNQNAKRRTRRKVSIVLPNGSETNQNEQKRELKLPRQAEDKETNNEHDEHTITPVTPTLKRTRSTERRSSSSSVTTPTSLGIHELDKLDKDADATMFPQLSNEESQKLRRKLHDILAPVSEAHSLNDSSDYRTLSDMFPIPSCFANWYFDASELTKPSSRPSASADEHITYSQDVRKYSSPLLQFRSYRLTSFFRLHKTAKLASQTYSNKLNCNRLLCRYDLAGKCLDTKCIGQHYEDIASSANEIYLDLLWYCPSLLKTNDGKQITAADSKELQLKAAEETVDRLCRGMGTKAPRSVEDACRLLVGVINKNFGNKRSITLLMNKKRPSLCSTLKDENMNDEAQESITQTSAELVPSSSSGLRLNSDPELRYFIEDEKKSEIEKFLSVLKNNPANESVRIKLAQAYLDQSKTDDKRKKEGCVKLALHALCLGIELNDQSENLWSFYIPILRQHYVDTSGPIDQVDILDQALMFMPLSRKVWSEVLKWDWSLERLDGYFEQLIENLLTREQLASSEEHLVSLIHEPSYYSLWLLQSIVERCHLLLYTRGVEAAQDMLQTLLERLRQALNDQDTCCTWPLLQEHIAKLWLIYIYLLEYHRLPPCLYDHDISSHMFGMILGFGDVIVPFCSTPRLSPEKIRQLFEDALYCSTDFTKSRSLNAKRRFLIYKSMVNFLVASENWEELSSFCRGLVKLFAEDSYAASDYPSVVDVWIVWTEAVMKSNDIMLITQTFDEAVTACPQSARLTYMSALYQLTSDSSDVEAALIYLEKHVSSLLDLQDAENLSATDLHQLYRRILRHDITIRQSTRLVFKSDASQSLIEKEKPYLWLIYCTLTELMQSQDEEHEQIHISDLYEAALHILPLLEDRKVVWIQYLLYLRSNALSSCSSTPDASSQSSSKPTQRRDQLAWFKRFTSVVRRCLATIPCKYTARLTENVFHDSDVEKYTDYSFHNETSIAMGILTDAMPTNIPLLIRAASHFLHFDDHFSVISLLWRMTSQYCDSRQGSCKDIRLWRMAMQALVRDGKYKKAIHLCIRAVSVLPRTKDIWRDVTSLILAYGDVRDLRSLNDRCQTMLSIDMKNLVAPLLTSL